MHNHITIFFPPFKLSFKSPSPGIIDKLSKLFAGNECSQDPDFTVLIIPSTEMPSPITQIQNNWVSLQTDETSFSIGPHIIDGSINLAERKVTIAIRHDFFNFPMAEVFQGFLQRLYHSICSYMNIDSYFIHACGVVKEDIGYLFIGTHQSGKTTIGKSSAGVVIHDDQILIRFDNCKLFVNSPPLAARDNLRHPLKTPCAIERIFVIKKADNFFVKRLNATAAVTNLYQELITPATLTADNKSNEKMKKSAMCLRIIKTVPVYELYFDKEGKFWNDLRCARWSEIGE